MRANFFGTPMNADITPMNADDSLAKVVLASGIDDIRDRRNGAFPTLKGLSAFIGVISAFIGVPRIRARITPQRLPFAALLLTAAFAAHAQLRPSQPEPPSGWTPKKVFTAKRHVVVSGHPLASEAGAAMLDRGGSAVDAAIATQLVLGLVEPQASGLGGGAFFLHHDASTGRVTAIDGRETAPAAAGPDLLLAPDGKPMEFQKAVAGGRAVGVPGTPRLLEVVHARHGRLPWADLFAPAIALAEKGWVLSPRVHALLEKDKGLSDDPAARAMFFGEGGKPLPAGTVIRNPAYAATLRAIAAKGADAFYEGAIAADLVATVRGDKGNPGVMTAEDLAGYRVRDVEPLCAPYRSWRLCGMPPSSSGGIAVLQMLGILSHHDLAKEKPNSPKALHLFAEAGPARLRRPQPLRRGRPLRDRARRGPRGRGLSRRPGPAHRSGEGHGPCAGGHAAGHEARAGRRSPRRGGGYQPRGHRRCPRQRGVAHHHHRGLLRREAPGARIPAQQPAHGLQFPSRGEWPRGGQCRRAGQAPRSSMAPFLVQDGKSGRLEQVVGSPGGSLIIGYVAKTLVATLDWNLDMQSAIDLPNAGSRGGPTELEKGTALESRAAALKALGHDVRLIDMTSGLAGIRRTATGWEAGADPRREGAARGR
jgi:gamma-glutamyltranspeptidase/glutathione hydrolase